MALRSTGQAPPTGQPGVPDYLPPQTEGRALASLILGVLALFLSIITGVPAIILGHRSLAKIKKSSGQLTGESMALAGLILGYVSVALMPFLLMIAIPNLQRSKMSANQVAAVSTVRILISAELNYADANKHYAPDLATLGPGGPSCSSEMGTPKNACMLDSELGCVAGTSGKWCEKEQYRYSIFGINKGGVTEDYIITATPVNNNAGNTNYCASSDAVVRSHAGGPLPEPVKTVAECNAWQIL